MTSFFCVADGCVAKYGYKFLYRKEIFFRYNNLNSVKIKGVGCMKEALDRLRPRLMEIFTYLHAHPEKKAGMRWEQQIILLIY